MSLPLVDEVLPPTNLVYRLVSLDLGFKTIATQIIFGNEQIDIVVDENVASNFGCFGVRGQFLRKLETFLLL